MKKYFLILSGITGILVATLFFSGCTTHSRVGVGGGYYSNHSYGYGDGQPYDDYYYTHNQQSYGGGAVYQQTVRQSSLSFNDFYHQLSPYGTWVTIAPYGQVWVANVPNFQPYYSNGHWTYTNYGWTWVSNYSWGWAPFHYGRWGHNNRYGWYWVPGYVWGPAWVAWSSNADMYGWAPLMPGMNFNVSLSVGLFPSSYWTFMPGRYMGRTNINNYYVNRSNNVTIINNNTTIINNYGTESNNYRRYSMGPSANDVQRHTGSSVNQVNVTRVSESSRAGMNAGSNELRVYRPTPSAGESQTRSQQSQQPANNASQTRTQQGQQPANNATQTRTQQGQQPANNNAVQTRSSQSSSQQDAQRSYQPNPSQPRVTNSASPQTSRQIQSAQQSDSRVQQQQQQRSSSSSSSSSTSTRSSNSNNNNSNSSNTNTQSRR